MIFLKFLQYEDFFAFVSVEASKETRKSQLLLMDTVKGEVHRSGTQAEAPPRNFIVVLVGSHFNFHKKRPNSFLSGQNTSTEKAKNLKIYQNSCNIDNFLRLLVWSRFPAISKNDK